MFKRLFLIVFFFAFSLFSEETAPYEMIDFGGEPSAIVEGCVNVITGDFIVNRDELIVKGHEPIHIPIRYYQRDRKKNYGGWDFGEKYYLAKIINIDRLEIFEKSGIRLEYYYDESFAWKDKGRNSPFKLFGKLDSWTNTFLGDISARANPLNNIVYSKPGDCKEIVVESPDGSVRYYRTKEPIAKLKRPWKEREFDPPIRFYLQSESLPNGNYIEYTWSKIEEARWRVVKIESKSSEGNVFAWVKIHYQGSDQQRRRVTFETSNHQKITYYFDPYYEIERKRTSILTMIDSSNRPYEKYTYWKTKEKDFFPDFKEHPDGRNLKITYYSAGDHPETGITIREKHALGDLRYNRVKALYEPLGETKELLCSHLFAYSPGTYKKGNGATDVFDADQNLTRYHYSENFVLTHIEKWRKREELLYSIDFEWTSKNWLERKTIQDPSGKTLVSTKYVYDEYGNIIQEVLLGNLTGTSNELEPYTINREYYPNHLLSKETFPNGKMTRYFYHGSSNLLSAKITHDPKTEQHIRTFYAYENSILTCEIIDDGKADSAQDLTGVTERLIKRITPNRENFLYGMPHSIEEKYLDLNTNQEILLKKCIIHYDEKDKGNISRIDHYDANDTCLYTISYSYDEQERLIAKTDPLGRTRTFKHDNNFNLCYDNDSNEAFEVYQDYDFMNRPIKNRQFPIVGQKRFTQLSYNLLNQKISEEDFRGHVIHATYDPLDNPTKITLPPIINSEGNLSYPTIERTYDALRNILSEKDPENHITRTEYTSRCKPTRIMYPDKTEETCTYDINGNLLSHLSPSGVKTTYTYDFLDRVTNKTIFSSTGKILSEESFAYNSFHLMSKTDPDGTLTTYTYDGAGRQIQMETVTPESKRKTAYAYDALGRMYQTTHYLNDAPLQIFTKTFDQLNRVLEEREEDASSTMYCFTRYSYDDFSNNTALTKEVQVGPSIEHLEYDSFRRLTKKIDPLGNIITIHYDDLFEDTHGQHVLKKTTTNPRGTQTIEVFDPHENLILLEKISPSDTLLLREEFFYNTNQLKTKQISTLFDPHQTLIKTWNYNNRSELIELREAVGEPSERITRYTYTPDGQLQEIIKPDGVTITYAYDGPLRQTEIHTSDNLCHYLLTYDKMGNVIESNDLIHNLKTTRLYNHFGELIHETLANNLSLSSSYDDLGRRTSLTFEDGSTLGYSYDAYHLTALQRYDPNGTLLYTHHYMQYDLSHHLLEERTPLLDATISHTYDLSGHRIETDTLYSKEKISSFDPCGNVLEYKRTLANGIQEMTHYSYDALDQLLEESGPISHNYIHDAHHNRLQKDHSLNITNTLHQLLSQYPFTYTYDPNGNRISNETESTQINYSYDGLDRLIELTFERYAFRFTYDSWNRLITIHRFKLEKGEWTHSFSENLLYDDQNELGEYPLQYRILGPGHGAEIGAAIAVEGYKQVIYFPIHDLFGNVIAFLNDVAQPLETYRYSAFGEELLSTSLAEPFNPWRYQSKRTLAHLVFFGCRFYDPQTGRWISPDPKGFTDSPNLYQFLLNNPLLHFDLYGLSIEDPKSRFLQDALYVASYTLTNIVEDIAHLRQCHLSLHYAKALSNLAQHNKTPPERDHSKIYKIGGEPHPNAEFLFINGIFNSKENAIASAKYLSSQLGNHEVTLIYNSSHGALDFLDVLLEKAGAKPNIVNLAEKTVRKMIQTGKDINWFMHSEGGLAVKNCVFSLEERSHLNIFSFGSAAVIPRNFGNSVYNYVSSMDGVAQTAAFLDYRRAKKENFSNVQFLNPMSNNIFSEHGFMNKTYQSTTNEVCQDLRIKYGIQF